MCVCVCVCVCACASVSACVCVFLWGGGEKHDGPYELSDNTIIIHKMRVISEHLLIIT